MKTSMMANCYASLFRSGQFSTVDFIHAAKELELDGIELMETFMKDPDTEVGQAEELLKEQGIRVASYDIGADIAHPETGKRRDGIEKLKEGIKRAARLNPVVLLSYGSASHVDEGAAKRYVNSLKEAAEFAGELGLTLTIENQGKLTATSSQVKAIVEDVGLPNMKATIDVGNFTYGGEDNVSAVRNLLLHVGHAHAKDWTKVDPEPGASGARAMGLRGGVLGRGIVDLEGCFAALKEANYDGFVSLEYEGKEREGESVREGIAYLRRLIG